MVYIKLFKTEQEKQACTDIYEYVSYTEESNKVNIHEEEPHDYSKDYLTFVIRTNGTINFSGNSSGDTANTISYSTDNGTTWSTPSQETSIEVNSGDNVLWKGEMTPGSTYPNYGIGTFSASTASFDAQGNIMSLLFGDNFVNQIDLTGKNYAFHQLFYQSKCINAKNLVLPATTLSISAYTAMFSGCTSLTKTPELPATTLADNCYTYMFADCTSLTTAPQLPATTLAQGCYLSMFYGCKSLTTAPQLPATTLANYCYRNMFNGCTSLTTPPELPATTLASSAYTYMFANCTSLTTAPELPATTLVNGCYNRMFEYCRNLNYIKAMFTTTPSTTYTNNWVSGVASSGTFVKNSSATWNVTGVNGVPNGWTVETASA